MLQPCDWGVEPPVSHVGTPVTDGSSGARWVLVRRGWNQQAERGLAVRREVLVCPGQSASLLSLCDDVGSNPLTDSNVRFHYSFGALDLRSCCFRFKTISLIQNYVNKADIHVTH